MYKFFFFDKGIAFIAPIDRSLFTAASTRGTVKSEHFVTGACNRTGTEWNGI